MQVHQVLLSAPNLTPLLIQIVSIVVFFIEYSIDSIQDENGFYFYPRATMLKTSAKRATVSQRPTTVMY